MKFYIGQRVKLNPKHDIVSWWPERVGLRTVDSYRGQVIEISSGTVLVRSLVPLKNHPVSLQTSFGEHHIVPADSLFLLKR